MYIIKSADFLKSVVNMSGLPAAEYQEFAFIGRSNVGKSSLMNMLLARKNLVKTSKKPGKTAALNYFLINKEFYFVDLPGYGFARKSQTEQISWRNTIERYLETREVLKNIFILIDSRHGFQKNDEAMIEFLEYYNLPYSTVFTKTDKLKKSERNLLKSRTKGAFFASSVTKEGREEIWDFIESLIS